MQVAFYLAGEITQVKESIPWVRRASGNVLTGTPRKSQPVSKFPVKKDTLYERFHKMLLQSKWQFYVLLTSKCRKLN